MEAKYYTPEIEEFHVGFECEQLELRNSNEPSVYEEWEVCKIDTYDLKIAIENQKDLSDFFRIKHLDRSDIEELGWVYSSISNIYSIELNDMSSIITNGIWMYIQSNERIKIIDCRIPMHEVVFNGYIKNKSELKKLMKMLNIKG